MVVHSSGSVWQWQAGSGFSPLASRPGSATNQPCDCPSYQMVLGKSHQNLLVLTMSILISLSHLQFGQVLCSRTGRQLRHLEGWNHWKVCSPTCLVAGAGLPWPHHYLGGSLHGLSSMVALGWPDFFFFFF